MSRHWHIEIPVRPKCVQSMRMAHGRPFVDPKVRQWKETIRPFIRAASPGRPSKLPIRVIKFIYRYQYPKAMPAGVKRFINDGGEVPYLDAVDITDNMNKGVVDVCKGIVFEDDSQIWWICCIKKLYGAKDSIELEFEETPDVILKSGQKGASLDPKNEVQDDAFSII